MFKLQLNNVKFQFITRLIFLGYRRPLEKGDVWELESNDVSQKVGVEFRKFWKKELRKSRFLQVYKNITYILIRTVYKT